MGGQAIGDEILREVEQFLYREARSLDERRFHEWLELLPTMCATDGRAN